MPSPYDLAGLGDSYSPQMAPRAAGRKSDDLFQFILLAVTLTIAHLLFYDNIFFLSAVVLCLVMFLLPHQLFSKWAGFGLLALLILIPMQQIFLLYLISYAFTALAILAFVVFLWEELSKVPQALDIKP